MTTSRIVRGTKARIFLYVSAVLIITGIIACYNNTLSQLENVKKASDICLQQEENLSTQLQVISDYKQRLEKSLKTEKAEHQQAKNDLENKLNEEKTKNEKVLSETNLRFSSLQQHFNLLQTQYDDLQTKLKQVQEELKEVTESKESLRSKYLESQQKNDHLEKEKQDLQNQVAQNGDGQSKVIHLTKLNHELQNKLDDLKGKCPAFESIQPPNVQPGPSSSQIKVSKQLQIDSQIKEKKTEKSSHENQNVANEIPPNQNFIKTPTKSTTSSSLVSQGSLNGARPLLIPTVTPKVSTSKKTAFTPSAKKLPEGVVPVPEKRDIEKKTEEEHNELPNEAINNRYRNKIGDTVVKEEAKKVDEADKENVANEVFGVYDNFGLDVNDPVKNAEKQNFNKQHIDQLGVAANKNYDNEENQQIEENEPEDDDPEYADHMGRIKEPVIRN